MKFEMTVNYRWLGIKGVGCWAYLVLGVFQVFLGHVPRLDSLYHVVLPFSLMPRHVDLPEGAAANGLHCLVNVHILI